jgi:hypothetical protein
MFFGDYEWRVAWFDKLTSQGVRYSDANQTWFDKLTNRGRVTTNSVGAKYH